MVERAGPILASVCLLAASPAAAPSNTLEPWPAEPYASAVNLTDIEGPGANDFHVDLSGAVWNPSTRTLWVCRNGPGAGGSKLWAAVEDGSGGFKIDSRDGNRGEWTGFGDFEGVAQADWEEDAVYAIIEGEERIKEYDVSTYGVAVLRNVWDTSPYLPLSGGSGAEGITFVPDSFLTAAGFVDGGGAPRASARGMGGLMFVGHQTGGALYAFDLDRTTGEFDFVGEYATGYPETAALEFDRSTGGLYVWHDDVYDVLSLFDMTSEEVPGGGYRNLLPVRRFAGPSGGNNEGIAIVSAGDCADGERSFFLTVDGGGGASLLLYRRFQDGCAALASLPHGSEAHGVGDGVVAIASPNPFAYRTTILYRLAVPSEFSLRIYDPSGRLVRTLVEGRVPGGAHEAAWDGRDEQGRLVGPGVYFCAPGTARAARPAKLILVR